MQKPSVGINSQLEITLSLIAAGLLTLLGGSAVYKEGLSGAELFTTILAFALLISSYLLLATYTISEALQKYLERHPRNLWLLTGWLLIPYLIYVAGTGVVHWTGLCKLIGFIFLPTFLVSVRANHNTSPRIDWRDVLAIMAIWLPFDFRWLTEIWIGKVVYGFNVLLAVNLAVLIFVCYRNLPDVGYHFYLNKRIFFTGLKNFCYFAPIAIILGLSLKFLEFKPQSHSPLSIAFYFLQVFMFTAIPEELLFRGIIQNLFFKTFQRKWPALILASLLFGLAHWNNAPTVPKKLSYCLLATIAGIFYGRAYLATGSLLAAAITHALIDVTWHELFR